MATRSVRLAEPVLIWPALVATAMSAMVVSSVSPLRWLMIVRVAVAAGQFDGFQRFGQGADLVDLDENAVGRAFWSMPCCRRVGVRHEQVVADELAPCRPACASAFASRPSRLRPGHPRCERIGHARHSFSHRSIISSELAMRSGWLLKKQ